MISSSRGKCSVHAVLSGTRTSWNTYEVSRRFESDALRSLTCAFCVARNWILSCSRREYIRRSDCDQKTLFSRVTRAYNPRRYTRSRACNARKAERPHTRRTAAHLGKCTISVHAFAKQIKNALRIQAVRSGMRSVDALERRVSIAAALDRSYVQTEPNDRANKT